MFDIYTGFIAECVHFSSTRTSQWCLNTWQMVKKWAKYCTD